MAEVVIKLEVPKALEAKSKEAIEKVLKEFVKEVKLEVAKEIISKSELTEEQAKELAEEVELEVAKKHGLIWVKLVVDANRIFSALIKRGFTLDLLRMLSKLNIELVVPQYLFEEIEKRENKLLKYSKLSKPELEFVLKLILENLKVFPKSEYEKFFEVAKLLAPHPKDVPYFALALALNCPIWSDEKAFKKQSKIKVFSTKELIEFLSKIKL